MDFAVDCQICLSSLDDKRWLREDGVSSYAYGHKDIPGALRAPTPWVLLGAPTPKKDGDGRGECIAVACTQT